MVEVYRSITPDKKGWIVCYPRVIDELMGILWNHGLCHKLIRKNVAWHVRKAKESGEWSWGEVTELTRMM